MTFGGRLAFVLWIYPAVLCQTMFFASVVNVVLELSEVLETLDPKKSYVRGRFRPLISLPRYL